MISREGSPEGFMIEIDQPQIYSDDDLISLNERILVLYKISDPGNLGTLVRTARAFNWNRVILLDNCVDPFHPECIRSSMGAVLKTKLHSISVSKFHEFIIKKNNIQCYIADSQLSGTSYSKEVLNDSTIALILGSEANGLKEFPQAIYEKCQKLSLKMENDTESLNVAVCGGILMNMYKYKIEKT